MIFDFLLLIICFYLSIPAVLGYAAWSYGRSFWVWFALGAILPVAGHIILYFLIDRDMKTNKLSALLKKEEIEYMEKEIQQLQRPQPVKKTTI